MPKCPKELIVPFAIMCDQWTKITMLNITVIK